MNERFLKILLALAASPAFPVQADAPDAFAKPAAPAAAPTSAPMSSARPSDEAIKAAVRAVLEEMPAEPLPATGTALSGGAYREFARKFSEAEKAHCLRPDALKHQAPGFSTRHWNFGFGGLAALPFWGAAILRGKCGW